MNELTYKRGYWCAFVDGKKRKFLTKEEALIALGVVPEEKQEEFKWPKKFFKNEDTGLSDS